MVACLPSARNHLVPARTVDLLMSSTPGACGLCDCVLGVRGRPLSGLSTTKAPASRRPRARQRRRSRRIGRRRRGRAATRERSSAVAASGQTCARAAQGGEARLRWRLGAPGASFEQRRAGRGRGTGRAAAHALPSHPHRTRPLLTTPLPPRHTPPALPLAPATRALPPHQTQSPPPAPPPRWRVGGAGAPPP